MLCNATNGFEKIVANIDLSVELPNLRFKLRLTVDFFSLQILKTFILKVLHFLKMRLIFVSSVHNFGKRCIEQTLCNVFIPK